MTHSSRPSFFVERCGDERERFEGKYDHDGNNPPPEGFPKPDRHENDEEEE